MNYNDRSKKEQKAHSLYPNTFQHPNLYVDQLSCFLTPQENVVLTKAVREILGWQDNETVTKRIALSVFVEGKFKKDMPKTEESRLCYGCGLGREAVIKALNTLDKFGILVKSDMPNKHDGQAYTLQLDAAQIDWEGLKDRKAQAKASNKKRIKKARKKRGLSDSTSTVPQTDSGLSDRPIAVCATDTKKPTSETKKRNSSSCGLDSEKPETANGRQSHDDDEVSNLLYQAFVVLGFWKKSQRKIVRIRKDDLRQVQADLESWADNGIDELRQADKWRARLCLALQEGDTPAASVTPKSDVADFTQDKQYKFFAELEAEEKQAASGNGQGPPLTFLDKMRQMTERLDAKQPVVHDYTGFNSYNPEDGSYNL